MRRGNQKVVMQDVCPQDFFRNRSVSCFYHHGGHSCAGRGVLWGCIVRTELEWYLCGRVEVGHFLWGLTALSVWLQLGDGSYSRNCWA